MKNVMAFTYRGGKARQCRELLRYIPDHDIYVEAFMGAASLVLNKARVKSETINDINSLLYCLFKVLRDQGDVFIQKLKLTPYSREEFDKCFEYLKGNDFKPTFDLMESARCVLVYIQFSVGHSLGPSNSGFSTYRFSGDNSPAHSWVSLVDAMNLVVDRLRDVIIENRNALELIDAAFDTPKEDRTFLFLDPPYYKESMRRVSASYGTIAKDSIELEFHEDLLELIADRDRCKIMICGYTNDLYDDYLHSWRKVVLSNRSPMSDNMKGGKGELRDDCIWMNWDDEPKLFSLPAIVQRVRL